MDQRDKGEQLMLNFSACLDSDPRRTKGIPAPSNTVCLDNYRKSRLRAVLAENLRHSGLLGKQA